MISVITGAGSGIGAAASAELARRGHSVVLVGRDPAKLGAVADRIAADTTRRPDILTCDYSSFDKVRELAATLLDRYERIDVLANNAGVMTSARRLTGDGHELIMQVNHLSPFLLTTLLLDRLDESGARVIATTSRAARTGRLDPDDLDRSGRRWSGWLQYGDAKQAIALFTAELARRRTRIATACFHPGVIRTGFAADTWFMKALMAIPGLPRTPEEGAATLVHLAARSNSDKGGTDRLNDINRTKGINGAGDSGRFFVKNVPVSTPRSMTDPTLAGRLWSASLAVVSA
jgi:NAD(P)-dependent dehydrogenase (short-subunit alcohol dehydrogenase family)